MCCLKDIQIVYCTVRENIHQLPPHTSCFSINCDSKIRYIYHELLERTLVGLSCIIDRILLPIPTLPDNYHPFSWLMIPHRGLCIQTSLFLNRSPHHILRLNPGLWLGPHIFSYAHSQAAHHQATWWALLSSSLYIESLSFWDCFLFHPLQGNRQGHMKIKCFCNSSYRHFNVIAYPSKENHSIVSWEQDNFVLPSQHAAQLKIYLALGVTLSLTFISQHLPLLHIIIM